MAFLLLEYSGDIKKNSPLAPHSLHIAYDVSLPSNRPWDIWAKPPQNGHGLSSITRPPVLSRFRMMLCIVFQMTWSAHRH
jgi:hypothetical protein